MIVLLAAILLAILWPRAVATLLEWLIFFALVGALTLTVVVVLASHFA